MHNGEQVQCNLLSHENKDHISLYKPYIYIRLAQIETCAGRITSREKKKQNRKRTRPQNFLSSQKMFMHEPSQYLYEGDGEGNQFLVFMLRLTASAFSLTQSLASSAFPATVSFTVPHASCTVCFAFSVMSCTVSDTFPATSLVFWVIWTRMHRGINPTNRVTSMRQLH